MRHSRETSNYLEKIILYNPTHIMSMTHLGAIDVETLRIDSGYSLEKKLTKLICMNP